MRTKTYFCLGCVSSGLLFVEFTLVYWRRKILEWFIELTQGKIWGVFLLFTRSKINNIAMPLLMCVINIRILTKLAWSIKIYNIMVCHTFMSHFVFSFVFAGFCCKMYSWNSLTFLFSLFSFMLMRMHVDARGCSFSSSIPTEKSQKIVKYCHGKYFVKENLHSPAWTSGKFYCGNKKGNPERVASLLIPCSFSLSQHGIWFILPAHGACHYNKMEYHHILLYFLLLF